MKQFESFALDTANECLWHNGAQIALASKPFAVLRYLVENPGRLITHDELLDALWPSTYVQPQVLRTYVLELRKVLRDDARDPKLIKTIPKRGYSFVATVKDNPGQREDAPAFSAQDAISTDLVARDEEIVRLQTIAQHATGGRRQLVFITGEAGIGKTSLANALRRILMTTSSSAQIVFCHCVEGLSEKECYYALMEALGQCFASVDGDRDSPTGLGRLRALQDRPTELCDTLEELAQQKLFVLVIEDIQWAHQATLELISALARRGTPAKLLVIATYRPQDRSTKLYLKSVKQDLLVRHLCTELALEPLSKQSLKRLLIRRLHQEELPPELAAFIYQRSGGNPLFANALLDHMIAEKFIVRDGAEDKATWKQIASISTLEISVPQELARLIELEIDRLDPLEQRVLEAGSLMNIAFPVWAAAAALDENSESVEEMCDALERRTGLIRRAGHDDLPNGTRSDFYTFAHEFYREVLYQRQTTARRAKGHMRIAEQLQALFAGRESTVAHEIAMQYEAAGNWERTVSTLRSCARHSQERQAHQEAAHLLEHALRIAENLGNPERSVLVEGIESELEAVREAIELTESHQRKAS
jgi:predicted ATPase